MSAVHPKRTRRLRRRPPCGSSGTKTTKRKGTMFTQPLRFRPNRSTSCYRGLAKGKNMSIIRSFTPARRMISQLLHCHPTPAEPPIVVCSSSLSVIRGIYRPRLIPEILPHRCGKMTLNPAILLFLSQFFRERNRPIIGPLGVQMQGIPTRT
jgi:hypothetical protein